MYEIFLFINPIGTYCFDVEQEIEHAVNRLDLQVCYHFIPLANLTTIREDILRRSLNSGLTNDYSYYNHAAFGALKYYHAVRLSYGNRRARAFLCSLQADINEKGIMYGHKLIGDLLEQLHIDPQEIDKNLHSTCLTDSINQDAELAKNWQIRKTPTTIIFNDTVQSSQGLLLEGKLNQAEIQRALLPDREISSITNHLRLL